MDDLILTNKYLQAFMDMSHAPESVGVFDAVFLCNKQDINHEDILLFEHEYRRHPNEKVWRISGRDFVKTRILSHCRGGSAKFTKPFQQPDLLVIEDVEDIAGMAASMEAAYTVIDYLPEHGRRLVFSSEYLPGEISGLKDRNRAQLEGCLMYNLRDGNEL